LSFIDSTKTKEAQAPTDTSQYSTPLMGSNSLPKGFLAVLLWDWLTQLSCPVLYCQTLGQTVVGYLMFIIVERQGC